MASQSQRPANTDQRVLLLVVAVLLSIGLLTFLLNPPTSNADNDKDGSTHSAGKGGSLALYLWLQRLGYQPQRIEYSGYDLPPNAKALFILNAESDFNEADTGTVRDWVRAGHTLFVAEGGYQASKLLTYFDVNLDFAGGQRGTVALDQPLLLNPPVQQVRLDTGYKLDLSKRNTPYTVYLDGQGASLGGSEPLLIGFKYGSGQVYITTASTIFSNVNLGQADNAKLLLNLLGNTAPGAVVAFDEYHHGFLGEDNITTALTHNPWGWAIIYAALVLALYLIATGLRFGRVVPLVPPGTRRSSAEYVTAVGGMFRRAGRRLWVVDNYRRNLRADLAKTYGLDLNAPAAALVTDVARLSPRYIDKAALQSLLEELDRSQYARDEQYSDAGLLDLGKRVTAVREAVLGK